MKCIDPVYAIWSICATLNRIIDVTSKCWYILCFHFNGEAQWSCEGGCIYMTLSVFIDVFVIFVFQMLCVYRCPFICKTVWEVFSYLTILSHHYSFTQWKHPTHTHTHTDMVGSECVFTIIMFPVVALHLLPLFFFCNIYWVFFTLKQFSQMCFVFWKFCVGFLHVITFSDSPHLLPV